MKAAILDVEFHLPERVVTNEELGRENPHWEMSKVAAKSGVLERRIAAKGETALDLARAACDKLFGPGRQDKSKVDAILFCTQSPDHVLPSNAFLLHDSLGLSENVLAFDFNLACSGFVYGLELARALITARSASAVLLVTAETYSKHIHPKDRSARVLFGDGAAATLVGASEGPGAIVDALLASSGRNFSKFFVPAGGCRVPRSDETSVERSDLSGNIRTQNDIHMDGMGVWSFIQSAVPRQIKTLLSRNALELGDVDLFVFHQASKMTLDSLVRALGIDPRRSYFHLSHTGNTVSASIPIALRHALAEGCVKPGAKVLLSGFGAGLSWGTVLLRY